MAVTMKPMRKTHKKIKMTTAENTLQWIQMSVTKLSMEMNTH
jgi:hypothetical protein